MTPRDRTASGRFRILVIANETVEDAALHEAIVDHVGSMPTEILLVAPTVYGPAEATEERLDRGIAALGARGIAAYGWVGHADPVAAIAGALVVFAADELIVATYPMQRSNWLARDVVRRARGRFGLPVAHVVVDNMLVAA
jgi:GABA permease